VDAPLPLSGLPDPEQATAAERSGGAEGNGRLTAMTGAALLILLAVECYTILRIGRLLTLHVFLGMLLLGPVTLKAGSVLYRFARYYTGSAHAAAVSRTVKRAGTQAPDGAPAGRWTSSAPVAPGWRC
jgi:hypothetical protein